MHQGMFCLQKFENVGLKLYDGLDIILNELILHLGGSISKTELPLTSFYCGKFLFL